MPSDNTGLMSNRYTYQPLQDDGPYSKALEHLGGALGGALVQAGEEAETLQNESLEHMGEAVGGLAGYMLGYVIDNAHQIAGNAETFVQEISDWRSWSDATNPSTGLSDL